MIVDTSIVEATHAVAGSYVGIGAGLIALAGAVRIAFPVLRPIAELAVALFRGYPVASQLPPKVNGKEYVDRNDCHLAMSEIKTAFSEGTESLRGEIRSGLDKVHDRIDKLYERDR